MKYSLIATAILSLTTVAVSANEVHKSGQTGAYTASGVSEVESPYSERQTKAVSYSFAVDSKTNLDFSTKQSHIQSRQYSLDVTGQQLKSGVSLNTSAKGALVRIAAFDGKSSIEPESLSLTNQKGDVFKQSKAFDTVVDSTAMSKNAAGFQQGTTGFKIADNLGAGSFVLKANKSVNLNTNYRINVFEKQSDMELHLTSDKNSYLKNDTLKVDAKVFNLGRVQDISSIKGNLVSPTGRTFKVDFRQSKDGYELIKPMDMSAHSVPGALWELHTEAQINLKGKTVQRNGQLPFAFAEKTASLGAAPIITGQKQSPTAQVPVSASKDGRYEVRAMLYGTDSVGNLQPIMVTHSAANLAAGEGMISMKFDKDIIAQSGLNAPFKLEQLELRDQDQMVLIDN